MSDFFPMTSAELFVATSILAATDALFEPRRDFESRIWPAICQGRRNFFRAGAPWASGAVTEAGRKASQRLLEDLSRRGVVAVRKSRQAKTASVRLSDQADDETRRRIGIPGAAAGFETLKRVAKASRRPAKLITHAWIAETTLNRGRGWGDGRAEELKAVVLAARPALARGWLVSQATPARQVYFAVTPTGWDLLDSSKAPATPTTEADVEPDALDLYVQRIQEAKARLGSALMESMDVGLLPLPVANAGEPLSCFAVKDYTPL